jgi:hypothetical protein
MLTLFVWAFIALGMLLALMVVLWLLACLATALDWMWVEVIAPVFEMEGRS